MNNTNNNNKKIRAIIGLGNVGSSFYYTRHNIGFRIVDQLAEHFHTQFTKEKNLHLALAEIQTQTIGDEKIYLIKPQTFMNDSGRVIPFLTKIKQGIAPEEILVIHDDLELPLGKIALKFGGSANGHNGLKSIISVLGSKNFHRLRFGISRPPDKDFVASYILEKFSDSELQKIQDQKLIEGCVDKINTLLR